MARMSAEAVSRWGRIDILAANAGIYPHILLGDLQRRSPARSQPGYAHYGATKAAIIDGGQVLPESAG